MAGLGNRKALYSALDDRGNRRRAVDPAAGVVRSRRHERVVAAWHSASSPILVGVGVGYKFGGYGKGLSARTGAVTAFPRRRSSSSSIG